MTPVLQHSIPPYGNYGALAAERSRISVNYKDFETFNKWVKKWKVLKGF
jgi:hypothetical protein